MKLHQKDLVHATPFRVLIVEDSEMLMTRLSRLLGEIPGVVVEGGAGSVAEADRLLEECRANLVILDLALPDGTGLDVVQRHGALGRYATCTKVDTTFVVFTNHVDASTRRRALVAGADYFFDKSRDLERMLSTVARLAGSRRPAVAGPGSGS